MVRLTAEIQRQCADDSIFGALNDEQAAGNACIVCPANFLDFPRDRVELGNGTGVYACAEPCARLLGFRPEDGWQGGRA